MPAKRRKTPAPGRGKKAKGTSSEDPPPRPGAVQTTMEAYFHTLLSKRLPDETDSEPERETEEVSTQEEEEKKEGSCPPPVAAQPSGPRARSPEGGGRSSLRWR